MRGSLNSALGPIFFYSRLVFFSPYGKTGKIVKWRLFVSFIMSSLMLGLPLYIHVSKLGKQPKAVMFMEQVRSWRRLLRLLTTWAIIIAQNYYFIFHPSLFYAILKKIRTLSKVFNSPVLYTKINIFVGITNLLIVYGVQITFFFLKPELFFEKFISYFMQQNFCTVISLQVIAMFEVMLCLFKKLNEETKTSKELRKATVIHSALCSVVADVNRIYSVQLFFLIADTLTQMTTQVYQIFMSITGKLVLEGVTSGLPLFLFGRMFLISALCHLSTQLVDESKAFHKQLVDSMRNQYFPCVDSSLTLYIGYKRSVVISAAGIFTITNNILSSLIATGATYFIVIVQMN